MSEFLVSIQCKESAAASVDSLREGERSNAKASFLIELVLNDLVAEPKTVVGSTTLYSETERKEMQDRYYNTPGGAFGFM